jgi:hypothetical protein
MPVYVRAGARRAHRFLLPRSIFGVLVAALGCALPASAADAATYDLRPVAVVESNWNVVGAWPAHAAVDDPVTEPTAVSSADFVWAGGQARGIALGMQRHQLADEVPITAKAWFYANTGYTTQLRAEVRWGGAVRASVTLPALSGFTWRSISVTPPDQAALDDLSLRFVTSTGTDSNVRAAYVRLVTGAKPADPGPDLHATPPDPRPDAVVDECVAELGSFGPGNWPGACWRPYADTSPFNTPIPSDARIAPNSAAMVSRLVGFGPPDHAIAGTADTWQDWSHPTYYASPTDPLYTLRCTAGWGTCALEGMQVRIPSAARPAAGSDAHMTIIDQAGGWEYPLWGVEHKPAGGGTLLLQWSHGRIPIDGSGLRGGGTAAHFGNLAGIIRAQELAAREIDHALFMGVRCDRGSYVYPASGRGRTCLDTADALPMGSRLQLDMPGWQIDALAVPAWKKTVLHAMATYGMYVGDTGGNAWSIGYESGSTYTSFGAEDEMVRFARREGLPSWNGNYRFDLDGGVDWARYLRVIDPCTTQGTCSSPAG